MKKLLMKESKNQAKEKGKGYSYLRSTGLLWIIHVVKNALLKVDQRYIKKLLRFLYNQKKIGRHKVVLPCHRHPCCLLTFVY